MTDLDKIVAEAVERGFRVLDDPHLEVPAEYDSAEEHALNESARHAARHAYAAGLEAAAEVLPSYTPPLPASKGSYADGYAKGVNDARAAIRALKGGE